MGWEAFRGENVFFEDRLYSQSRKGWKNKWNEGLFWRPTFPTMLDYRHFVISASYIHNLKIMHYGYWVAIQYRWRHAEKPAENWLRSSPASVLSDLTSLGLSPCSICDPLHPSREAAGWHQPSSWPGDIFPRTLEGQMARGQALFLYRHIYWIPFNYFLIL